MQLPCFVLLLMTVRHQLEATQVNVVCAVFTMKKLKYNSLWHKLAATRVNVVCAVFTMRQPKYNSLWHSPHFIISASVREGA